DISDLLKYNYPLQGIQYAVKSMDVAEAMDDRVYAVKSRISLAFCERFAVLTEASISHYEEALERAREYGLVVLEADCHNGISRMLLEKGRYDEALKRNGEAFRLAMIANDSSLLSTAYLNLGLIMKAQKKNELAIQYLKESYNLRTKFMADNCNELLIPLWHLSDLYFEQGEFDKAKDFLYMYINNYMNFRNEPELMSRIWQKISQIYYKTDMLDSAVVAGNMSLFQSLECRDLKRVENACKLLDSIYLAQGNVKRAADVTLGFINTCDTMFSSEFDNQLKKIHYSTEYIENERDIQTQRYNLMRWAIVLGIAVLALVLCGILYAMSMRRNRRIDNLHSELRSKRAIMDKSLLYAKSIQMAVQPEIEDFGTVFSEKFLIYIPRDIVSGDFFWKFSDDRYEMLAVADCTGHGIPGAMLTMLGTSTLLDIASQGKRNSGDILNELRDRIKFMMGVNSDRRMMDGMDISLMVIDKESMVLDFAGAFNSLFYIRDGKFQELRANRCPIGEYVVEKPFKSQYLQLQKDDYIYVMSDGYGSQFSEVSDRKITQGLLQKLILEHHREPMSDFRDFLVEFFLNWKGNSDQIDDVTIAGFRV
ncbi:MAG: tetratricopeptide repeat protein, partial [Bacteroidales bacterium]|nr:tetratricopeptide repeat protein [Bacteroidales bacterium]